MKSTALSRWWLSCVPHEHTTGKPKRACPIHGKWRPSLSRRPRRRAFLNLLLSSKPLMDYFHSEQSGSVLLPSLILPLVPPAFRPKITVIQGRGVTLTSMTPVDCRVPLNVEPFRVQMVRETSCVSLVRFDHPSGISLPTNYSSHDAAENFRVNIVEHGWFRLKYGRREWTLGSGSIFLSRPSEVYGYSHVKYAQPDTCLRVEFYRPLAGELSDCVFRLPLVLPSTNRLAFLRLRLGLLLSNAAEMSLDAHACELVDAAANAQHDGPRLYRPELLRWYGERIGAARELMDCNPTAHHSLWRLSSQVGMSVFLFARVFRELVGTPPHKYLVRRRLQRARDLLRSGMPVTDVCYAAGFNNLSHFIRTFRAYFGMSPSKFKSSSSAPATRRVVPSIADAWQECQQLNPDEQRR